MLVLCVLFTVKPPIKDTLEKDELPYKGQSKNSLLYTLRYTPKENNLSLQRTKGWVPEACPLIGFTVLANGRRKSILKEVH